ncbi:hypothetical protein BDY21DRAFT_375246 [Lineolata rhizophorae]|uniref:3'(2'),5'-bisphosphate nucleotidase n=1 Tax=Lineolata rhizophorae TaxID=578093 RepID=A0A6A6NNH1_9PEZI|nr:hypothetical protein BDY21DRAFT_375246 [Lineolata rhizophorae]
MPYETELRTALLALQRASLLTRRVALTTLSSVTKSDRSPVTVGDFGAQALVISALRHAFPDDAIVAEEDAAALRDNEALRGKVWDYVQGAGLSDEGAESSIGGPLKSERDMLDAIDGGASEGFASAGSQGRRVWALDPIDGTKGFLRGGQYAIALALLVDAKPVLGVLACPNLPQDASAPIPTEHAHEKGEGEGYGVLVSAVAGQGTTVRVLGSGGVAEGKPTKMREVGEAQIGSAVFCESVESGHSSHDHHALITQKLGVTSSPVRMDSQAKYASLAMGLADVYLRLPVSASYQEKIWDHAAGEIVVKEAGGMVGDVQGRPLDWAQGRTLKENKGVVVAGKGVWDMVISAVKDVLAA